MSLLFYYCGFITYGAEHFTSETILGPLFHLHVPNKVHSASWTMKQHSVVTTVIYVLCVHNLQYMLWLIGN